MRAAPTGCHAIPADLPSGLGLSVQALRSGVRQPSIRCARIQVHLDRQELEAVMMLPGWSRPYPYLSRRSLLATPLALAACAKASEYFGTTQPPTGQQLTYLIGGEPETLDPARTPGGFCEFIIPALFEGLTGYHPQTLEPMAALAKHYRVSSDELQYTFFLRGHPAPRGIRLPNTDTLRVEFLNASLSQDFSRGKYAPPDSVPARWSDGSIISAHDFVYSW